MAHVLVHARFGSGRRQQQRPLLRHRAALHHAPLCHHLHCILQVEDEQGAGLHHVPALLYLPGPQRDAGGSHHYLPRYHLSHRSSRHRRRRVKPEAGQLIHTNPTCHERRSEYL